MTVEIPLTRGRVALVDDEDAVLVEGLRWRAVQMKADRLYAVRSIRLPPHAKQTSLYMHALLTGYPQTDHIDGDGLNNQRSNLRPASNQENGRNRRANRNGTSIYKGVSLNRGRGRRWKAGIKVDGRMVHLGYYDTEIAAALAYDHAARETFGQYAALNFPEPGETAAGRAEPSTIERTYA